MTRYLAIVLGAILAPTLLLAGSGKPAKSGKPDIIVITQNQYLGADLTPIITAGSPAEYNQAVLDALYSVAANNIPERAEALALSIADRDAHLVGLQEVFKFECTNISPTIPGACQFFSAAMNDHLQLTMDALQGLGADYYVAGIVENLNLFPGLPVFLDLDAEPDVLIRVLDRDVILARGDINATAVDFPCFKPSADGCNYDYIASAEVLGGVINIERGFVGVDATINDQDYRFVNTHLEVQSPSDDPLAPLIQAIQATQLVGTLSLTTPPGIKLLVVGDINSSPLDPPFPTPLGIAYPPYQQLANGTDFLNNLISFPYSDIWTLRPGKPKGFTCCQAADLSNAESILYERIDVIFSLIRPAGVKANVLNNNPEDKTPSGLWPSDHATVVGRLFN
jgi:hypothetical protein